ncbi:MAG: hypothetical protein KF744_17785 [Taibaiella sp.]|nr:hypothetical protein [Taibaiella sp.]
MEFKANNIYHVYNRGNNRQNIFLKERNYVYFLEKTRKYVAPVCDIFAYVLMPNHFHFLIHADERTEATIAKPTITRTALSEAFRLLLSSYSKGINKQEGWTGNLIQQKTKAKMVFEAEVNDLQYATSCFHYIHQNPLRAGLVSRMEDWHYSSYRDYAGLRNGSLPNRAMAVEKLCLPIEDITRQKELKDDSLKNIW